MYVPGKALYPPTVKLVAIFFGCARLRSTFELLLFCTQRCRSPCGPIGRTSANNPHDSATWRRRAEDFVRPARASVAFQHKPTTPPRRATWRKLAVLRELHSHGRTSHRWPRKKPFANPRSVAGVATELSNIYIFSLLEPCCLGSFTIH